MRMMVSSSAIDKKYVLTYAPLQDLEVTVMTTVNVTEARAHLYKLIDDASMSH